MSAQRSYSRRSDDQRISELQAKIDALQQRLEAQRRVDQEVLKHAPKLIGQLRNFAKLAAHNGRVDITNTTVAFMAGLERMLDSPPEVQRRARRALDGASDGERSS